MAKPVAWTKGFSPHITLAQQGLVLAFESLLVGAAAQAAFEVGALDIADAGKHGQKMQERFFLDGQHRFYRASVGSTVERSVYKYLKTFFTSGEALMSNGEWAGVFQGSVGTVSDVLDLLFAVEYTDSYQTFLPCQFKRSRPDLRLALGPGSDNVNYEALFDLTSEGQVGHILKKGDQWLSKAHVAYVSEIVWVNDDIMHK
jgi:hypothetical protein